MAEEEGWFPPWRAMPTDRQINPPCDVCMVETLHHSDPSGGWNECPSCHHMQDIRRTPPGEGKLQPDG